MKSQSWGELCRGRNDGKLRGTGAAAIPAYQSGEKLQPAPPALAFWRLAGTGTHYINTRGEWLAAGPGGGNTTLFESQNKEYFPLSFIRWAAEKWLKVAQNLTSVPPELPRVPCGHGKHRGMGGWGWGEGLHR